MKYWLYVEPAGQTSEPVYTVMSDAAIIAEYFDYWRDRMQKAAKPVSALIEQDYSRCIDDWVVVHWAVEATPEALLQIISAPNYENLKGQHE